MREYARGALGAVAFLTTVPVGRLTEIREADLRRGVALFPLVGAGVGLIVAAVAWAAAIVLPPFPAGTLAVTAGVGVTAAFHLDGLGDMADGVGAPLGGRDPLPAMLDPRLGTFGVAAVVLDLVLKVSLVAALVGRGFPWAVVAAASMARVTPVSLAWPLAYVGSGTGGWTRDVRAGTVLAAMALASAVAGPAVGPLRMVLLLVVVGSVALVLARWSRRRLGGVTGDVFGASAELAETLSLAAAVAAI